MSSEEQLEQRVLGLIVELMSVLWANGIHTVSMGALMRLVGVPDHRAQHYDDHLIDAGSDLAQIYQHVTARTHTLTSASEFTLH